MDYVDVTITDRVATVTINRPEVRNALHAAALFELSEAFDWIEQDDDVWLAVLTGAGDQAFSAGRDLKRMAQASRDPAEQEKDDDWLRRSTRFTDRYGFPKPVIARLNGSAYGGGLELALACDLIIAAEHARIGLPEPRRGLIALAGGVHRLARQLPLKKAMGYLLTGRDMSVVEAERYGLVNEVVATAMLDEALAAWIDDIQACAPLAVRATKECAMQGLDVPLADAATRSYPAERRRLASEDALEGPRAFAEKRSPNWHGR